MVFTLASFLMPPLLVFGVYHLLTWFNTFAIDERTYWRRVALASGISHLLLVTGFLVFSYFDLQAHVWRLMTIFDTAATFAILGLFSVLDRMGINPPGLVLVTFAVIYVMGTLQWYWLGGGIGALMEKFWAGLKTGDEEEEEWF